jgi:hypothetical protein
MGDTVMPLANADQIRLVEPMLKLLALDDLPSVQNGSPKPRRRRTRASCHGQTKEHRAEPHAIA